MSLMESLLIVLGLSLNVFLVAEYEGTMLKKIDGRKLAGVCGIFFLWQCLSMLVGHSVSSIPFFQESSSEDLKQLCGVLAAIIFLILAVYMLYKAWKREIILERLSEIQFRRIFLEAAAIGFLTFLAGIGCGFLGARISTACIIMTCATVLAVIAGTFTGYYQGCKFRTGIWGAGGILFTAMSVYIFIQYL